jgi:hypothetical protein
VHSFLEQTGRPCYLRIYICVISDILLFILKKNINIKRREKLHINIFLLFLLGYEFYILIIFLCQVFYFFYLFFVFHFFLKINFMR